ncbi:MAG: MFS transporter [Acidobacteria bacterium]|nr:MFS transporter [Acidobacteriota bacterium]MCI0664280.1 MFS transporter [Acidobacteriota bacterium]
MFSNKRLIPIFIVVFVDLLGFSIILPLLPYYASKFGASPQTIGILIASYSFCQFIAAPILGHLSDRYGRRPILLYSQIGSCIGFILMGKALQMPNPLLWLFVARITDGLSGGNLTVAQAYISDITNPEERAKNFGMIIGVSFGLGFLIGPTLGGFLSRYGYDVPAYAAAIISFASIMATWFLLPETQHQRDETRPSGLRLYTRVFDYLGIPELRRLLMVFFFMTLPFAIYVTMFPLFADRQLHFTAEQAGYFLGFVGFLGIIWQGGLIGPFLKRFGDYRALIIGLIASACGLFYLAMVDAWWKLAFVAFFFSFGHGTARPSLTSIVTQSAPANRRGGVLGAMTSIESFTRIIAPILGGWIIALHPSWLGWIGGILFSIAVIVAATVTVAVKPSVEPQRSPGS